MKRRQHGFGFGAIVVEAVGAMFVLYLLFPGAGSPVAAPPQDPAISTASLTAESAQPLSSSRRPASEGLQGDIPVLSLPAPPGSSQEVSDHLRRQEKLDAADEARRQFVAAELEYSRGQLIGAVKRHLESIVE